MPRRRLHAPANRRATLALLAMALVSVGAAQEPPRAQRARTDGLPDAMAGGISIEPPQAPLRGNQRLGLPANRRQARRGNLARTVEPGEPGPDRAPGRTRNERGRSVWHDNYGLVPPRARQYLVVPPEAGINEDKRLNPVPPSRSLGEQSRQDPTLQLSP